MATTDMVRIAQGWADRLKFGVATVDGGFVQFERLVIDAAGESYTLDFHERLTVIADVGRLEREGLVNELVGALGDSRSGVHLEMVSDAGNRFAIFRPAGARHLVVDIDSAEDVSDRFRAADGSIDLLARAGLDVREAKRRMRIVRDDLHTSSETDRYVEALAQIDQYRLWDVAETVLERERHLNEEADATGSAPEDAAIFQRIEELHREAEQAAEHFEQVRSWSMWGSFASIIAAVPIVMSIGPVAALPFIVGAAAAAAISLRYYRRVEEAQDAEQQALAEVGANSYLNFHLQRVNNLLSSDQGRKRLMSAAEEHRAALAQWELLAGEISVHWAIQHREKIRAAAAMTRTTNQIGRVARSTPEVTSEVVRDVSAALVRRLEEIRTMGPGGESFPVILDEPFAEVPESARGELLERVARAAGEQQVVFLTEDPEVAAWARVEAMTGDLAIVEPTREDHSSDHPSRGRHVAA